MEGQSTDLSGIASVISSITADPDLMNRLRSAVNGSQSEGAASDGVSGAAPADAEQQTAALTTVQSARGGPAWSGADRRRLLEALRPFLSRERREKADTLINVIALLDSGILDSIVKGGR